MGALNPSQYILEWHLQNQATLQKKAALFITSLHFTSLSGFISIPTTPSLYKSEFLRSHRSAHSLKRKRISFCTSEVVYHFNPISPCLKSHLMACGILSPKFEACIWMFSDRMMTTNRKIQRLTAVYIYQRAVMFAALREVFLWSSGVNYSLCSHLHSNLSLSTISVGRFYISQSFFQRSPYNCYECFQQHK